MRVISGIYRSIPLEAPKGNEVRPTTDKIKETLFNMLQFELPGCVFYDLFCGSGAIGIEALSRGAKKACFVDRAKESCAVTERNLQKCRVKREQYRLLNADSTGALSVLKKEYDEKDKHIYFLDPPYGKGAEYPLLFRLSELDMLSERDIVILETSLEACEERLAEAGFTVLREKRYKNQRHLFLRKLEKKLEERL